MTNWNIVHQQAPKYRAYSASDLLKLPELQNLGDKQLFEMRVISQVLPFKSNNYVTENLIDWTDPDDPIFVLTFPQRGMLEDRHFNQMADAVRSEDRNRIRETAHEIRLQLNPHPAGQKKLNTPHLADGTPLDGMQHKYQQTVLFFASQGQTCHAYCTFCFRWPQFVALDGQKFAMKEADLLVQYLREHEEVTDVLFTGGDPMVMRTKFFRTYVDAILTADLPHIKTIRIGTKAISYWPYRFINDKDAGELLDLFRDITDAGLHLAVMAHVNHPNELQTEAAELAIARIRETGAVIRTQSPLMTNINDDPDTWAEMWRRQLSLGVIPYYMFLARDTGAQNYFATPLARAHEIYSGAIRQVSGLGRTVRGPSMSCTPGKVEVDGVTTINGEKVFVLRMLQGRNPDWAYRPFFAKYDRNAIWLDDLKPAFGEEKFFFERDNEWEPAQKAVKDSELDEINA
ncbi:MAG: lysine 2,3-aminomutase [Verrucomicrobiales bacterium]|nr:lysine 2,3-aminomutase [Verrucomicrobiales bacterium]